MKHTAFTLTAAALTLTAVAAGWGIGVWKKSQTTAGPSRTGGERGRLLFQVSCASCHGPDGKGDGVASAQLKPPPRDFASRPWRFPITRESIRRVTLDGIPGTAMPSSKAALTPADIDLLVEFVYDLANGSSPNARPLTDEDRLIRDAGFTNLLGDVPPKLELGDAAGKTTALADLRGKLVVLHFWGTGCIHCIKDMPALEELSQRHGKKIAILHVCADEDDAATAQQTLNRHAPGVVGHVELSGLGLARYGVDVLPTTWLIGSDGKAIAKAAGGRDWTSPEIDALLRRWMPPTVPAP